jgi:hypothetical protein
VVVAAVAVAAVVAGVVVLAVAAEVQQGQRLVEELLQALLV